MKSNNGRNSAAARQTLAAKPNPETIRLLICDDHTLFREGIKAIISSDPATQVIGEASDGQQAVECALQLHPNVILMDVSMPGLMGYEAISRITKVDRHVKILALTMYEDEEIISLCLNAGASGYVLKDAPAAQLLEAIHIVSQGGKYLSPRAMQKVVTQFVEGTSPAETRYDTLSSREREVLKLLADGQSVKDVATVLKLSIKTVEAHKYNLMRKLNLHSKTELIKYALRRKLITFPTVHESRER